MTNICPEDANSSRSLVARPIKRRASDDANIARRTVNPNRRLTPERLLGAGQELPLAAHVVTSRRGYLHHGIYVGNGTFVHYAGFARGLHRGSVEEVSLADFTRGRPAWIRSNAPARFEHEEIIRRARSRIGENCYRLLSNNCEHFCEWCLRGEPRSYQVEPWVMRARRALQAMTRLAQQIHPTFGRSATNSRPDEHPACTSFA